MFMFNNGLTEHVITNDLQIISDHLFTRIREVAAPYNDRLAIKAYEPVGDKENDRFIITLLVRSLAESDNYSSVHISVTSQAVYIGEFNEIAFEYGDPDFIEKVAQKTTRWIENIIKAFNVTGYTYCRPHDAK